MELWSFSFSILLAFNYQTFSIGYRRNGNTGCRFATSKLVINLKAARVIGLQACELFCCDA